MATILESVMLICFGCSWPMSLMTNIRAKSAKGMNLWFYVMISAGYVAGIAAKLVAHNITYVLAKNFDRFHISYQGVWYEVPLNRLTIDNQLTNAALAAFYDNMARLASIQPCHFKTVPTIGDTRINPDSIILNTKPKDILCYCIIHPRCRTRKPRVRARAISFVRRSKHRRSIYVRFN